MTRTLRLLAIAGLACAGIGIAGAADAPDCSQWTLDGYHVGMEGRDVLAVRSVTLHVDGQAQAVQPGKFHGVLVLDRLDRLETWDVAYDDADAGGLRDAMQGRLGKPTSDVTGNIIDDATDTVRQRRTIWWSSACDAAIIVYEDTSLRGTPGHTIHATLARASTLPSPSACGTFSSPDLSSRGSGTGWTSPRCSTPTWWISKDAA